MGLHLLSVGQYILALLRVHPGDAIEKTALETQGNRGTRLQDSFASLLDVDLLDRLA